MKLLKKTTFALMAVAMYLTTPSLAAVEYPTHWGEPPLKQTRDKKKMPYPFEGFGSGTLVKWISKNQSNFPKHWGKKPVIQTADLTELPGPYGLGSTTLKRWISMRINKKSK